MTSQGRGNRTNHPTKPFAKRRQLWSSLAVDEYTSEIIDRAVIAGLGESRLQAVNKGICLLLGIPYKTDDEVLAERQAEQTKQIMEMAHPKTQQELDEEVLKKAEEIRLKREQQDKPPTPLDEATLEELKKNEPIIEAKLKEIAAIRESRRQADEEKQNATNG